LLQALLEKHLRETIYMVQDNASPHQDEAMEAIIRRAAGRLILRYLPTLQPIAQSH